MGLNPSYSRKAISTPQHILLIIIINDCLNPSYSRKVISTSGLYKQEVLKKTRKSQSFLFKESNFDLLQAPVVRLLPARVGLNPSYSRKAISTPRNLCNYGFPQLLVSILLIQGKQFRPRFIYNYQLYQDMASQSFLFKESNFDYANFRILLTFILMSQSFLFKESNFDILR